MRSPIALWENCEKPNPHLLDLEVSIGLDAGNKLLFEVDAPDPEQGINALVLPSVSLPACPQDYLHHLFKDVETLPVDTDEARTIAEKKLAAKGLSIWALFPVKLQELLWQRRDQAQTLLIQSDEPHIPWEIAKLQGYDEEGRVVPGPFLCEAFAVTRWLRGKPFQTHLPIRHLALVVPESSGLTGAAAEKEEIRSLFERHGRAVPPIQPVTFLSVESALASGSFDGWHFAGHGHVEGDDANRWHIDLDEYTRLAPEDLGGEAKNLGLARPLVFLNGCTTGRGGLTLTGAGGWSQSFLDARAGAFIGTCWEVSDGKSRELAKAFYENLLSGLPIGEAFRRARLFLHEQYKGDLTWLAYTVFAHPLASCTGLARGVRHEASANRGPEELTIPVLPWRSQVDTPGGLLRAQYRIVPFHSRERELGELQGWCLDSAPVKICLYTGPGGMGKTRLALELALKMRGEGWWAGFVTEEAVSYPEATWEALARSGRNLLLIVDYAENRRPFLTSVLQKMYKVERGAVRLLLLARAALDWWEQLKTERSGVGELLSGGATSRHALKPLADSLEERVTSYQLAAQVFSEHLLRPLPSDPPSGLEAKYFERVLLLHMSALIDVEGDERAQEENGILDRILAREKDFWKMRAADRGLSPDISFGIGRGMAAISLGGGVPGEAEAVAALRGLRHFADQPTAVLTAVARILHECYPGELWIEPLQPDLLGEHLAMRELQQGADELFDLVFGARNRGLMM